MEVGEWQDSPLAIVTATTTPRRSLPPAVVGVVGTVLLHVALLPSVSFATRRPAPNPTEMQALEDVSSRSRAGAESLILISSPAISESNGNNIQNLVFSLPDLSKIRVKTPIEIDPPNPLGLEALSLGEDQAPKGTASGIDGAEQARLFGIYSGQMQARIDRVWRRPRTPVNEDNSPVDTGESFQCEAQIVQDIRGNVREVLLPRCNGSAVWRNSLVLAIQHASPMPAPPSNTVFSTSITLKFIGLSYFAGAPEDDYELSRITLVNAQ